MGFLLLYLAVNLIIFSDQPFSVIQGHLVSATDRSTQHETRQERRVLPNGVDPAHLWNTNPRV
jgi:hypothetical protein